jgi:exodeoxyribonuclease-3
VRQVTRPPVGAVGGVGEDGPVLTIATANVNGIRAAYKRGMGEWVDTRKADVLLLQEVRAPESLLREMLPADQWDLAHSESESKGRSGVAIASRLPMSAVRIDLDQGVETNTGRWVEADLEIAATDDAPARTLTVASAYLHSGTVGTPSMDEKYAFLELVTARMARLVADGGLAVVAGDLNIAHRNVDIKNWKGNVKSAGFLPEERAYVDRWLDDLGWHDLGRELGGEGPGPYTWWSWRGKAFDNDSGWRIDYQLATPELADLARSAVVERAEAYDRRWSDHAPLVVEYDL